MTTHTTTHESPWTRSTIALITVAALGYFVDVYDLLLFSIVRIKSLEALGLSGTELTETGLSLLDWQMGGMLIGGVLWGILGDKRGRLSVLFGSIIMYSVANVANGLVDGVFSYKLCRLFAGIGLAGELGAGITLVAETLPRDKRGIGTTIVASVGVFGAIVAALVGNRFDWRNAYFIGGAMGLALLVLRISVKESGLYKAVEQKEHVHKGHLLLLFKNTERALKYLYCIAAGLPIWFVLGLLVTFSPELGEALGIDGPVKAGDAVFWSYIGLVIGDVSSGLLSQYLKSRKKAIGLFILITAVFVFWILNVPAGTSVEKLYWLYLFVGVGIGYWAVLVTMASEQFGTNLRSTVTTSVPNFVRGAVVPMTFLFRKLRNEFSLTQSNLILGSAVIALAFFALLKLKDSFKKDLDFLEL